LKGFVPCPVVFISVNIANGTYLFVEMICKEYINNCAHPREFYIMVYNQLTHLHFTGPVDILNYKEQFPKILSHT